MKNKPKSKLPVTVPQQTRSTRTQKKILAAAVYHFYGARCLELERLADQLLDPEWPEPLFALLAEFTAMSVHRSFDYAAIIRSDALRITSNPDNPFALRTRDLNARRLDSLRLCLGVQRQ